MIQFITLKFSGMFLSNNFIDSDTNYSKNNITFVRYFTVCLHDKSDILIFLNLIFMDSS